MKNPENIKPENNDFELPGYKRYPASEDIYNNAENIGSIEEIDGLKHHGEIPDPESWNERWELTGDDLDVPGAEDLDGPEDSWNDDEENNYYSLGGDKDDSNETPSDLI